MKKTRISVEEFVRRGVERLCDKKRGYGLHTVHSFFNAAMALYFGEEVHPIVVVRDLIKKRKFLGKILKGNVVIYDPARVSSQSKGDFLRPSKIMIVSDDQRARSHEVHEILQATFDWSEVGRCCGDKMIFHNVHTSKNTLSSRDLRIMTYDKTSLTIMVRINDGTCFSYKIMMPNGVASHVFCSAMQYAINSRDEWLAPYTVHIGAHTGAEKALKIILAEDTIVREEPSVVSVAVVEKNNNVHTLEPREQKKPTIVLSDHQIRMLVEHFSTRVDIEAMIPKDLFLQVAMNVLGKGELSRGQRGRLIKFLHDQGQIVYVHNNYYAPVTIGYVFTQKAINFCSVRERVMEVA